MSGAGLHTRTNGAETDHERARAIAEAFGRSRVSVSNTWLSLWLLQESHGRPKNDWLEPGATGRDPVPTYFGLGSNLGNRLENLKRAAAMLAEAHGLSDFEASRVYETEPWGLVDQPPSSIASSVLLPSSNQPRFFERRDPWRTLLAERGL